MSTIAKEHKIDSRAKKIFEGRMPDGWLIRPQNPDYHVDYFIELEENSEPSGIFFFVQLKGSENIKIRKGLIKFSFSTKQLKYYLEKLKNIPLFIVFVDITSKKVFWLFIQKYLAELKNSRWKVQKFLTLNIPDKNLLEDLNIFKNEIVNANDYMSELWPSSFLSSAKKEANFFKSLDPRFFISLSYGSNNTIHYNFNSNELIDLKFKLKNGIKLQQHTISHGCKKIILKSNEVEIISSALLNEVLKRAGQLEVKIESPAIEVKVFLLFENEFNSFSDFIPMSGKLYNEKNEVKIYCFSNELPFTIETTYYLNGNNKSNFNFNVDFKHWNNKKIESLPYVEKLVNLFARFKNNRAVALRVDALGKTLFYAKFNPGVNDLVRYTYQDFLFIKKIQKINTYFNLHFSLPDFANLKKDDYQDINELYNIINIIEQIEKYRKYNATITLKKTVDFLKKYSEGFKNSKISLKYTGCYKFLRKEIDIGTIKIEIENPKFLTTIEEIGTFFNSKEETISIKITTDKYSKITVRHFDR